MDIDFLATVVGSWDEGVGNVMSWDSLSEGEKNDYINRCALTLIDSVNILNDKLEKQKCEIKKLRAENKELRAASEWRPIETAPKDGTDILCYDGCIIERVKWLRSNWSIVNGWFHTINPESLNSDNWNDPPEYCLAKPTHWQPLPQSPKGEDDEKL